MWFVWSIGYIWLALALMPPLDTVSNNVCTYVATVAVEERLKTGVIARGEWLRDSDKRRADLWGPMLLSLKYVESNS